MGEQNKIICPDCKVEIKVGTELEIGAILECGECGTEVEVTSVEPLAYRELLEEK